MPNGRRRAPAALGQALTELVAERLCAPDAAPLAGRFVVEGIIGEGACVREASLLVQLEHPGIVRVLDVFAALGTFFMVMPWVEGATLRSHIDDGAAFGREQVLRVADEGLPALTALHAAGLVHRDVKPSNLLVNAAGRLVLIDLGIACPRDAAAPGRRLVGSPSYCSPEQILGRPVDGRGDVYLLGCTLYELVFGRPPVEATDIEGAIAGHLHGTPSFDMPPRVAMEEPFLCWRRRCSPRRRFRWCARPWSGA